MPHTALTCCPNINSFISHNNPTRWVPPIIIHPSCGETEAPDQSLAVTQPELTPQKAGFGVHVLNPPTALLLTNPSPLVPLLISCSTWENHINLPSLSFPPCADVINNSIHLTEC